LHLTQVTGYQSDLIKSSSRGIFSIYFPLRGTLNNINVSFG